MKTLMITAALLMAGAAHAQQFDPLTQREVCDEVKTNIMSDGRVMKHCLVSSLELCWDQYDFSDALRALGRKVLNVSDPTPVPGFPDERVTYILTVDDEQTFATYGRVAGYQNYCLMIVSRIQ